MEPTLHWLLNELGLEPAKAGQMVVKAPRLLTASVDDNLQTKVRIESKCHSLYKKKRLL